MEHLGVEFTISEIPSCCLDFCAEQHYISLEERKRSVSIKFLYPVQRHLFLDQNETYIIHFNTYF